VSDIIGLGTDVVDVARLREAIERTPTLVDRLFADDEQVYARAARDPAERFAARFAAKEAALKALGLGLGGMVLRDIVVVRADSGAPSLELRGDAAAVAAGHGVGRWLLSLSHAGGIATATAIALR
jgi:holo-[acyl-carrier protein] synthase